MSDLHRNYTTERDTFRRVKVISGVARRRRWPRSEKVRIVAESYAPGASATAVAVRHGLHRNQIFAWRRQFRNRAALVDGYARVSGVARGAGALAGGLLPGDLARHLQIMLRTHSELGYRHEQRFHLELGLLKMTHAQRLLPLEQLLSEAGATSSGSPQIRSGSKPTMVAGPGEARRSAAESPPPSRVSNVSPFAADSARKTGSKPELSAEPDASPRAVAQASARVIMGSAAPAAVAVQAAEVAPEAIQNSEPGLAAKPPDVRNVVLDALAEAGHRMLVSMLEAGEWSVEGNELVVKVAASNMVIDMSLGAEAKRLATAAASGALGRPLKLKVTGGSAQTAPAASRNASNGSGRSRAEQDPIVRRMQATFGAEIRTIIDYRDKR